jgi:preprotein translocase subunit SecD
MRYRISLLPLFLLGLLTLACATGPSQTVTPPSTPAPLASGIRVLLLPEPGTGTPSPAALRTAQEILAHRLADFGFKNANVREITAGGQPALQIEVPRIAGDEDALLNTLLATGQFAFWDTGSSSLQKDTSIDPHQYTQSNGGINPLFIGTDLDASQLQAKPNPNGQMGNYVIQFAMKGVASDHLRSFTSAHIGDYMTITLDKKVVTSAIIQSQLPGSGQIIGDFTSNQAQAIVSVVKFAPLPITFQMSSKTNF